MIDSPPPEGMPREIWAWITRHHGNFGPYAESGWTTRDSGYKEQAQYTRTDLVAPLIEAVEAVQEHLDGHLECDLSDVKNPWWRKLETMFGALDTCRKATKGGTDG